VKFSKQRDLLLKKLVKHYSITGVKDHDAESLMLLSPGLTYDHLEDLCISLQKDGLVHIDFADDEIYLLVLDVQALRQIDEQSWIRKGYQVAKEIREWL